VYVELSRVQKGQNKTDMKRKVTLSVLMCTVELSVLKISVELCTFVHSRAVSIYLYS